MVSAIDMYVQKSIAVISPFRISSSVVLSRTSRLPEGRGPRFPCLLSGMMYFKWPLGKSLFSHIGKDLKCSITGHFKIAHDHRASLNNQCLVWETKMNGGQEAIVGDNTVHQIVPHI